MIWCRIDVDIRYCSCNRVNNKNDQFSFVQPAFPNSQASPQHRAPWSLHVWGVRGAVGQRRKRVKPWPRDGAASPQPTQGPHQAEGSSHSGLRWQRALNQSSVGMYYTIYTFLCHVCAIHRFSVFLLFFWFQALDVTKSNNVKSYHACIRRISMI